MGIDAELQSVFVLVILGDVVLPVVDLHSILSEGYQIDDPPQGDVESVDRKGAVHFRIELMFSAEVFDYPAGLYDFGIFLQDPLVDGYASD